MFYDTRDSRSMPSVTRRNDVTMQKHSVKKQETLLYNMHEKKSITFLA
jgi:hypothetical protein